MSVREVKWSQKKQNRLVLSGLAIVVGLFLITHLTPALAVRTNIFMQGHFKEAVTSKVTEYHSTDTGFPAGTVFFHVSPAPYESATGTPLDQFYVERMMIGVYDATYFDA